MPRKCSSCIRFIKNRVVNTSCLCRNTQLQVISNPVRGPCIKLIQFAVAGIQSSIGNNIVGVTACTGIPISGFSPEPRTLRFCLTKICKINSQVLCSIDVETNTHVVIILKPYVIRSLEPPRMRSKWSDAERYLRYPELHVYIFRKRVSQISVVDEMCPKCGVKPVFKTEVNPRHRPVNV